MCCANFVSQRRPIALVCGGSRRRSDGGALSNLQRPILTAITLRPSMMPFISATHLTIPDRSLTSGSRVTSSIPWTETGPDTKHSAVHRQNVSPGRCRLRRTRSPSDVVRPHTIGLARPVNSSLR
ncbi:hypothetical protein C8Q76DRAFT_324420 [Earliella scabrosa]|nr:hypothetical protein C8Q76DRAFT_324420 [Earliella scabrosa]